MKKVQKQTVREFLNQLEAVRDDYDWNMVDGRITATVKKGRANRVGSPLQAVANQKLRASHLATTDNDTVAASTLKMPFQLQALISDAYRGSQNRGYAQVLRGRIKSRVGLK